MRAPLPRLLAALAVAVVALGAAARAAAQSISGRIVDDATGRPLPGTRVELLLGAVAVPVGTATADSAGIFAVLAPMGGVYRLRFLPPGYQRQLSPEQAVSDTGYLAHEYRIPLVKPSTEKAYYEFEVEEPVEALHLVAPEYPAEMVAQRIEGMVIAQFVVDTRGLVERRSFRVIEASRPEFREAVYASLSRMRFRPARIGGVPVRALVQQPFHFRIGL